MQDILDESLRKLRRIRIRKKRMIAILLVLSLVVSLDVFWVMRQPGLTLAGDADCKIVEHTHDEVCQNAETICELEEHVHSISCYSDVSADVETQLDWQSMFENYPYTGNLQNDLVGIARTQVGYCESTLNFEIGDDGIRRGYTRYGAWYGVPYRDWSAIFVSFCLHYAGANPAETPGNTGAASMAEIWKTLCRFASPGEHNPSAGDLVFFANNTVGIVTEVQNATCYVICGDVNNAVGTKAIALSDESIVGWGLTASTVQEEEEIKDDAAQEEEEIKDDAAQEEEEIKDDAAQEEEEIKDDAAQEEEEMKDDAAQEEQVPAIPEVNDEYLLDISNGPVIFIVEGRITQQQAQNYTLRNPRAIIDLLTYLKANGGTYFFTLLDKNNHELPKDSNGNYVAQPGVGYKLTLSFTSPEGFLPGTYQYQIPNGLMVDGGEGTFILKDGTDVGSWVVTDTGLITMVFNEHINSRTDITISAALGIHFPEQDEPIDFDGKITVIVEKPQQEILSTKVDKWGSQGNPATEKNDPTKIYWTIQITGNRDSQIPGSVLTDQVLRYDWSYPHRYTDSDIAAGLSFGASVLDPETGLELYWHRWNITADDPNLTWDETGWSYKMPETVTCRVCGNTVTLGNEYWTYYVDYTSTPDATNIAGGLPYTNQVEIDNQQTEGWARFTPNEVHTDVIKKGTFVSDASGGKFLWELQVTLPGRKTNERAFANWIVHDEMDVINSNYETIGHVTNNMNKSTVTANYYGKTINVPRIQDATDDDPYVWMVADWSGSVNGIYNTRQVYLLQRCSCTPESCAYGGSCWTWGYFGDDGVWVNDSDYCPCWTETEDTTFTFSYTTEGVDAIDRYGGMGNQVRNRVTLMHETAPDIARTNATVPIPSVIEKVLNKDFDGYIANYKITVNESKLVLTNGAPLKIHDVMTDTLAYISGSLVITAEDANGNITTLNQGADYTVVYDGTGNQRDEAGNKVHVLDIVILHPQPVMYTLDYDATLIMPEYITEGIKYGNSAEITLWGESITDSADEKVYADINIAAKSYQVEMFKTCAQTGEPLGGATFGLYNAHGGLITTGVTNEYGELSFQTNVVEGIILREHILYYMQELRAPPGYRLDDTKYWFCFCDKAAATCEVCSEIMAETDATRIPFEQIGKVHATNEIMKYALPDTGGSGIYLLMLVSAIFVITPLIYGFIRRRKQERRGVG